jgi:hypothetical protein
VYFKTNAIDLKSEKDIHPSCLICRAWYHFSSFFGRKRRKRRKRNGKRISRMN